MKCDMCDKTEDVRPIVADGEVKNLETEDDIRQFVESYTNKKIPGFPHLCSEHFSYVINRINETRRSKR